MNAPVANILLAHGSRDPQWQIPFKEMTDLAKITQPCLIFGNDDDPLHPFDMAKVLHQHIKGSHLEKVTSRYLGNRPHKEEINHAVGLFIRKLLAAQNGEK